MKVRRPNPATTTDGVAANGGDTKLHVRTVFMSEFALNLSLRPNMEKNGYFTFMYVVVVVVQLALLKSMKNANSKRFLSDGLLHV